MPKIKHDRQKIAERYQELLPKYEMLGKNLMSALAQILTQTGVELYGVSFRVKDFDSFWDKVERGSYTDPFEEMTDICGIRIIHFYKSDLNKIFAVISEATQVIEAGDKNSAQEPEKFGYHDLQMLVSLKDESVKHPGFEGLGGLKTEIQVRTAVMNTWGDIQNELAYRSKNAIPPEFSRKFYQLDTFFDLADDMLDDLRREKERHSQQIVKTSNAAGVFQPDLPMNLDNLQAFLDINFPKRKKNLKVVSWLLAYVITPHNITINELVTAYEKLKKELPSIEKGLSEILKETYFFKEKEFERTQGIMLMTILVLTDDDYWNIIVNQFDERYWEKLLQFFHDWRKKFGIEDKPAEK